MTSDSMSDKHSSLSARLVERAIILFLFLFVFVGEVAPTRAHEGHRPLPTRGMELNLDHGTIILTKSARDTLDVETTEVLARPVSEQILAYGSLQSPWNSHALISSALPGRIVALHVAAGAEVKRGQLLSELESPELELLQLELRTAQIGLTLAAQLANSTEAASRVGAVAGNRFVEAQNKQFQGQAAVAIASAKWRGLGLSAETLEAILARPEQAISQRISLFSPIDGTISHADLSVGKIVDPKEHLFEVIDHRNVWLKMDVLEKDLTSVAVGQEVNLSMTAYPGETFQGKVDVLDDYLDPATHLGSVWATLSNPSGAAPRLLPGMSGQAQLRNGRDRPVLTVPAAAIIRSGAERFVLVETEATKRASTFQKQAVTLGRRDGQFVEVLGGQILQGDRVMTRGSHELGSFFAKTSLTVSKEAAADIALSTDVVATEDIIETISVDGIVDIPPTHRTVASSPFGGRLLRILIDRGAHVQKGDVLAEIVSQEFQDLQLELLKSDLDMRLAQSIVESFNRAKGALSERQLWEAQAQFNQARSSHDAAVQRLRAAGITDAQLNTLKTTRELMPVLAVTSPIDGSLINFDKFLGHNVIPNEPLFEIHDLTQAWVQGFLSERDLARVHIGQAVRLRFIAAPNEVIEGKIVRSGQTIGSVDRSSTVWIEMKEMPSFTVRQNMLARVAVETGPAARTLAVPREAVIREGTRAYVFVKRPDQVFERRRIEPTVSNDVLIGVATGLAGGETVAVRGAMALQSGFAALK